MAKLSLEEKSRLDNRTCESCGNPLVRTYGETNARWVARRFCSVSCSRVVRQRDFDERFEEKIDRTPGHGPNGDCHIWTGAFSGNGYGAIQINGKTRVAHRVSWERAKGRKIPKGYHVMHSCDNPPCVNPDHLTPAHPVDNMIDKTKKGRNNAPAGTRNGNAKIGPAEVIAIFQDPRGHSEIAKEYPISASMVKRIKDRRAWRSVTDLLP